MAAFVSNYWNSTITGDSCTASNYVTVTRYRIVSSWGTDTSGPYTNIPGWRHQSRAELKVLREKNAPRPKPTRRMFKEPALYTCQRRQFLAEYQNLLAYISGSRRVSSAKSHKRRVNMGCSYKQKRRNYVVKLRKGILS
jgi:hypothetical protein